MYAVTPRYGYFLLSSCTYDSAYVNAVQRFFSEVAASGVQNVVLDLRQNGGGNSNVILPWLQHLPLRYQRADPWTVPQESPVFLGTLYVEAPTKRSAPP